jgi:hypothetical protein
MEKQVKIKYYLRLFYKSNGEFIREFPVKNEYIAESQMAFYNDVTSNIRAEILKVEVEK